MVDFFSSAPDADGAVWSEAPASFFSEFNPCQTKVDARHIASAKGADSDDAFQPCFSWGCHLEDRGNWRGVADRFRSAPGGGSLSSPLRWADPSTRVLPHGPWVTGLSPLPRGNPVRAGGSPRRLPGYWSMPPRRPPRARRALLGHWVNCPRRCDVPQTGNDSRMRATQGCSTKDRTNGSGVPGRSSKLLLLRRQGWPKTLT